MCVHTYRAYLPPPPSPLDNVVPILDSIADFTFKKATPLTLRETARSFIRAMGYLGASLECRCSMCLEDQRGGPN